MDGWQDKGDGASSFVSRSGDVITVGEITRSNPDYHDIMLRRTSGTTQEVQLFLLKLSATDFGQTRPPGVLRIGCLVLFLIIVQMNAPSLTSPQIFAR
ncbi:hypothetical protein LA5095_05588 [Roseibium album]|uniref:Uncharacterized protein n=1 Tax=Roseibium album TaxID=311410 RepID=A0A0M7B383_9HYPH|nr:hypothetical protein LA5094_05457 [Roseibium album]CTQ78959.1 hypothetical protein LA5096_05942 [Roseibium album]CTQ80354.1 hypothetical protein LA5095_05588 [Roseibium album]